MNNRRVGFTIVELIVIIAVIAILAAILIVGYGNWRQQATINQLKSDLNGAASAMESGRNFANDYPVSLPSTFTPSEDVSVTVKSGGGAFCVEATSSQLSGVVYSLKSGSSIVAKACGNYFTDIATDGATVCGISFGRAYCWGSGTSGRLGNGTTASASAPVAVTTSTMSGKVTAIASGCAVATSKAYCWGVGGSGRLGTGSVADATTPVAVNTSVMTGPVTAIASNNDHACAIASGKAYCWGYGTNGQLGNGSSVNTTTPVAVSTASMPGTVTSISVGSQHTCAVASGKAYCWGDGSYSATAQGHLGNGTGTTYNVPTAVTTTLMSGTVTEISTSNSAFTCAIAADKAYCWGEGTSGQLGNGGSTFSLVPVAVTSTLMSGKVTAIANSCAVADDKAYCWGAGSGRIGSGNASGSSTPVAVVTTLMSEKVKTVISDGSGALPSCALANGDAYCWGVGPAGQLGNGTMTSSLVPSLVTTAP